jgi:EAL domain-containing protein (putative c-di-GMP-specific phosphodiesterase class I)
MASADDTRLGSGQEWSAFQSAAVAEAEAIAATAAAEVAAEAAATARAAVQVASAAARKAAARACFVAAQAVLAADAADAEFAHADDEGHDLAAAAAAKVAATVAAVATAAASAVLDAATLIGQQLAKDVAATATAVTVASHHGGDPDTASPEVSLADGLLVGIAAGQLRLHYQPIVSLRTGAVVTVEALVRWQHPVLGLLGADVFIETAEQTGLVVPLGEWVLHEACAAAVRMQARGPGAPTVAVNLSARQLSDGMIVDTVRTALRAHRCAAEWLVVEITETALVTDMAAAVASLLELKRLGIRLAIDDFGTGYSSLQYLSSLPADILKLDRSFISGLGGRASDTALVASVISLARNVDVECIAEGVETAGQLEVLEQLGCEFAQGYLFCRPVAESALHEWLDERLTDRRRPASPRPAASPETGRIVAMCESGTSQHTIAAVLNASGSRTSLGRRWSAATIAAVLARTDQSARP